MTYQGVYRGLIPIDEFEHTLRLRGPMLCSTVEIETPGFVQVWSLYGEDVPQTILRFRVVGEGQHARARLIGGKLGAP